MFLLAQLCFYHGSVNEEGAIHTLVDVNTNYCYSASSGSIPYGVFPVAQWT